MTVGWPTCSKAPAVGRIDLDRIVPPRRRAPDVVVGHDFRRARRTQDICPRIGDVCRRRLWRESLKFAVDASSKRLRAAARIAGDKPVPAIAPEDLDHVPSRAEEGGLEFLHDVPVPANRSIEALQIAVDDENQVVELFARQPARDGTK